MIYRLYLMLRNRAYDKGKKKVEKALVPTICVGNVTVGGTGKTPHTELILRMLQKMPGSKNLNISVLSRGYKRKSKGYHEVEVDGDAKFFGDEPLQIKKKFPNVIVAVEKNRVDACWYLAKERNSKLIVLDDAFQYRKLKYSRTIVLVDYNRPVFDDSLLPFGRLRDLPKRIFDSDVIIVTKCDPFISNEQKEAFASKLRLENYNSEACSAVAKNGRTIYLFFTTVRYCDPVMVFPEGEHRYIYCTKTVLFSGIAKDKPLRRKLSDSYEVAACLKFPDHHNYSQADINKILSTSENHPVSSICTTEKDAQRLYHLPFLTPEFKQKLFMVPIEASFTDSRQEKLFSKLITPDE